MSNPVPFRLEDLRLAPIPGAPAEAVVDAAAPDTPLMVPYRAAASTIAGPTAEFAMRTNRGDLYGILTLCQGQPGAVLWLAGRGRGLNGPAAGLYADLSRHFQRLGVTSLRIEYREFGNFEECVLDALACIAFLKAIGVQRLAVVGHSLGGPVAIAAGVIVPWLAGVAALGSTPHASGLVHRLAPRPLLLVHGGQDAQNPPAVSEDLYQRAGEPKELVVYPEATFRLHERREELLRTLGTRLADWLGYGPAYAALLEELAQPEQPLVWEVPTPEGSVRRQVVLTHADLVGLEADALVCPTGTWLDLNNTPLGRAIVEQGGAEIQQELLSIAPLLMGDVGVTRAGRLHARYVFHAITGGEASDAGVTTEGAIVQATQNALRQADALRLRSLALPALASGNRGFPPEKTAELMVRIVAQHLMGETTLERVVLSMINEGSYQSFADCLRLLPTRSNGAGA